MLSLLLLSQTPLLSGLSCSYAPLLQHICAILTEWLSSPATIVLEGSGTSDWICDLCNKLQSLVASVGLENDLFSLTFTSLLRLSSLLLLSKMVIEDITRRVALRDLVRSLIAFGMKPTCPPKVLQ